MKILSILASILVLSSCSKSIVNHTSNIKLKVNQSVNIKGVGTLTLVNLTDNRCPPDVQCIRAGEAIAEFTLQKMNSDTKNFKLCIGVDCSKSGIGSSAEFSDTENIILLEVSKGKTSEAVVRIE